MDNKNPPKLFIVNCQLLIDRPPCAALLLFFCVTFFAHPACSTLSFAAIARGRHTVAKSKELQSGAHQKTRHKKTTQSYINIIEIIIQTAAQHSH